MKDYVIQNGFEIKRIHNDEIRMTFICVGEGCPWRIHASPLGDVKTFKIRKFNKKHQCSRPDSNKEVTSI